MEVSLRSAVASCLLSPATISSGLSIPVLQMWVKAQMLSDLSHIVPQGRARERFGVQVYVLSAPHSDLGRPPRWGFPGLLVDRREDQKVKTA